MTIVVAWELSWYRFEVDLGRRGRRRRASPGRARELDELDPSDQTPNAAADDDGRLHLARRWPRVEPRP